MTVSPTATNLLLGLALVHFVVRAQITRRQLLDDGQPSRRPDCHFDVIPSPSVLKHLLKVKGGAAE